MSDTVLKLIPIDPAYVPPESRQHETLAALVKAFPEAEEPQAETYAEVTFIDNGENTGGDHLPELWHAPPAVRRRKC